MSGHTVYPQGVTCSLLCLSFLFTVQGTPIPTWAQVCLTQGPPDPAPRMQGTDPQECQAWGVAAWPSGQGRGIHTRLLRMGGPVMQSTSRTEGPQQPRNPSLPPTTVARTTGQCFTRNPGSSWVLSPSLTHLHLAPQQRSCSVPVPVKPAHCAGSPSRGKGSLQHTPPGVPCICHSALSSQLQAAFRPFSWSRDNDDTRSVHFVSI